MVEETVLLTIRCAHQSNVDQKVECPLSSTVLHLKEILQNQHPGKPDPSKQRLIYSGQLLKNETVVSTILRSYGEEESDGLHIIHLVYTPTVEQMRKTKSQVVLPSTAEGLRQRVSQQVSQQQSAMPSPVPGSTHVPQSPQQPPVYSMNQNLAAFSPGSPQFANVTTTTGGNPAVMANSPGNILQAQQMYSMYMTSYMNYLSQLYGVQYGGNPAGPGAFMHPSFSVPNFAAPAAGGHLGMPNIPHMPGMGDPAVRVPGMPEQPPMVPPGPLPAVGHDQVVAGGVGLVPPVGPEMAGAAAAPEVAAAAAGAAPGGEQIMNAQGGVDDEDWRERDWLDWIYMATRAGFLFMILYFYSSWERFLFVMVVSVVIYGYQNNWFGRHLDRARPVAPPAAALDGDAPPAPDGTGLADGEPSDGPSLSNDSANNTNTTFDETADSSAGASTSTADQSGGSSSEDGVRQRNVAGAETVTTPAPEGGADNGGGAQPPPIAVAGSTFNLGANGIPLPFDANASAWTIFWTTCYTFVTSFFTSLVPDRPPPM